MIQFGKLVKRNVKLFFKDKGLFFTSLITPLILLLLYSTFLGNIFRDSYTSSIPAGVEVSDKIISCKWSIVCIHNCCFLCDGCVLFKYAYGARQNHRCKK